MYKAMGMEWNNFREIYRQKRGVRVKRHFSWNSKRLGGPSCISVDQ